MFNRSPVKLCISCKEEQDLSCFYKRGNGHHSYCKECVKAQSLVSRHKNIDKVRERDRVRTRSAYRKEQKQRSRNKIGRAKETLQIKLRKLVDPEFKLRINLRGRLAHAIKDNAKGGSAVKDLGCSISKLKSYLESKFQLGMSWNNWALNGWHIDHIKPLSSFDLSDPNQVKQACHYTNLQPLWAKENMSKGDKNV